MAHSHFLDSPLHSHLPRHFTMTVSIDYFGFPHIFGLVITHCDFDTQNTLRLLSSDAKAVVDRVQCRHLSAYLIEGRWSLIRSWWDLPGGDCRGASAPPLLTTWNGILPTSASLDKALAFALDNTCYIRIDDEKILQMYCEASMRANGLGSDRVLGPPHFLKRLQPDSVLALSHSTSTETPSPRFFPHSPHEPYYSKPFIRLPPVKEVHVKYVHAHLECPCNPPKRILHSAQKLRMSVTEDAGSMAFCGYVRNLFTPTVERLELFVSHLSTAVTLLEHIVSETRHRDLHVLVICRNSNAQEALEQLAVQWTERLGCEVTAQWYEGSRYEGTWL